MADLIVNVHHPSETINDRHPEIDDSPTNPAVSQKELNHHRTNTFGQLMAQPCTPSNATTSDTVPGDEPPPTVKHLPQGSSDYSHNHSEVDSSPSTPRGAISGEDTTGISEGYARILQKFVSTDPIPAFLPAHPDDIDIVSEHEDKLNKGKDKETPTHHAPESVNPIKSPASNHGVEADGECGMHEKEVVDSHQYAEGKIRTWSSVSAPTNSDALPAIAETYTRVIRKPISALDSESGPASADQAIVPDGADTNLPVVAESKKTGSRHQSRIKAFGKSIAASFKKLKGSKKVQ